MTAVVYSSKMSRSWGGEAVARAQGIKQIAQNRKAFHDYFVLERYEAGIELFGTEVKSIRAGTESEGLILHGQGRRAVRPRAAHKPV